MNDIEWINLDPTSFNEVQQMPLEGLNVEVFLSPYDVPEAVRGIRDERSNHFVIEFKYIGGEEPVETELQGDLAFKIGKHSKRLYKIEIADAAFGDKKSVGLSLLLPKVDTAIDTLAKNPKAMRRVGNYKAAKKITHDFSQRLAMAV